MKPIFNLGHFLILAGSSLLAVSSASAQTTYTWTQTTTGNQDWATGTNWSGTNQFVSGAGNNELAFLTSLSLGAGTAITVTNVPTTLSMNVLSLNGAGPNSTAGSSITIGTNASNWTIGDGTTSTVNLNSTLGGGGADRDVRYTIGANLTLVGNASGITTFTGNSTSGIGALFSGNIGESVAGKGMTKSGSSLLVFSGSNSYTGTTSVTGGVLRLSSANALSGGIGATGGTSALTINGGVVELGAGDFSRGLGTGSSQFQITGGSSGFSAYGGPRVVTVNGDASQELLWGSTHFAPTTLILNQAFSLQASVYANGSIELANRIDLNAASRTVQVGANIALLSNDIRTTTGTAGLTKTGSGALVLTGNNTYNGDTTLSAGVLSVEVANNLGAGSSNLVLNGGTLQIRGTTLTSLTGLGRTVSLTNNVNVVFDIHNAANIFTVNQVLNNNNGTRTLTKSGVGTLMLNQNNTFTGATSASGGGKLVLDYATNNGSKLSDTAGLTFSGGALVLKGGVGVGANHAEVVSSTTLTTYTSNSISREGGTSTISLGGLTLNLNSSLGISEANIATTSTGNATVSNPAGGILSLGRVTVGSHFGANNGTGNIVAYSGYNAVTTAGGSATTSVNQLTGGGTLGASLSSYALRIVNDANSNVLNLGSNSLNLVNNSAFLYAGGFDNNYTINGTGALTSASGNQPFVINTYAGTTLTVNARTSSNTSPVSKAGAGTLVLGGNNSTVAGIFVQEGVLRVAHKDGLGNVTSGTTVQGGAALELANGIAIGAETLSLNGAGIYDGASYRGALRNQSGTNSWAGAITIGASGARINADASSSLEISGGIVTILTQDVTFGGTGNIIVSTAAISGSGSVIKDGAGILTLTGINTYTGATNVSAGTLIVNGNISSSSLTTVQSGGTLGGSGTVGRTTVLAGGILSVGNSPGIMTLTDTLTLAGSNIMEIDGTLGAGVTGGHDFVNLTGSGAAGALTYGGTMTLDIGAIFELGSYSWNLFDFASEMGTFTSITLADQYSGSLSNSSGVWDLNSDQNGFTNSWVFTESTGVLGLSVAAIPELKAALLGAIGMLFLLRRRR